MPCYFPNLISHFGVRKCGTLFDLLSGHFSSQYIISWVHIVSPRIVESATSESPSGCGYLRHVLPGGVGGEAEDLGGLPLSVDAKGGALRRWGRGRGIYGTMAIARLISSWAMKLGWMMWNSSLIFCESCPDYGIEGWWALKTTCQKRTCKFRVFDLIMCYLKGI